MPKAPEQRRQFSSLTQIVRDLRGPDGCPWDKEQTHKSLTRFALEEAHELAEAIDREDVTATREELGDLLLQVVLHAEVARQNGDFDIDDVIEGISEKMVRRHPHVFGQEKLTTSEEVLKRWENHKAQEKTKPTFDVPLALSALVRSHKIGDKTHRLNFDWPDVDQVFQKVCEEFGELSEEFKKSQRDISHLEHEIGDLLFSLAQLARHLNLDAEQALRICNNRFELRFDTMQGLIKKDQKSLAQLSVDESEKYWQLAKSVLAKGPHGNTKK